MERLATRASGSQRFKQASQPPVAFIAARADLSGFTGRAHRAGRFLQMPAVIEAAAAARAARLPEIPARWAQGATGRVRSRARPGESIRWPPPARSYRREAVVVCVPSWVRSISSPVRMSASGTRRLTSEDLPTPDWPTKAAMSPAQAARSCRHAAVGLGRDRQVRVAHRRVGREFRGQLRRPRQLALVEYQAGADAGRGGGGEIAIDHEQVRHRQRRQGHQHQGQVGDDRLLPRRADWCGTGSCRAAAPR